MMFPLISVPDAPQADVGKALHFSVGAASPLWFLYAGAATAGLTFWWMTRWPTLAISMAPTNLEAKLAEVLPDLPTPEPALDAPPLVAEMVEAVPAATLIPEPTEIEATVELMPEPVPEPPPTPKASKAKAAPPTEEPPLIAH